MAAEMAPTREERNANANKYIVNVSPSSTPNRRFLVFILAAAALVALVALLATLIPLYVTGNDGNKSNDQLSDRQKGNDFLTNNSTKSNSIGFSTTRRHSFKSVLTIHTSTSNTSPFETMSPSKISTVTSMLPSYFARSSATQSNVSFHESGTTTAKPRNTSGLRRPSTSAKFTSNDLQPDRTSPLPKMTSFTTTSSTKNSETSTIISSMSDTISTSSIDALSVIANLVPNTESKWSRWSPWSDCTTTCGTGTRSRTRTCVALNQDAVFAPISCAGKPTQIKSCAEWSCPDCSKTCTTGTLNTACDACTCDHHVLTGRILTEDDVPLSEVNISFAETPYNVLAQTNVSGYLSTLGVCADQQELLITKTGFVPVKRKATVLTPANATITVKLEIAVPPFITKHPQSKTRMVGQSVTFCCDGEGNPPPDFEWFKDGNIIDKEVIPYNNTLQLSDVRGLNGSYRCRLVNDFGSEFSDTVQLKVLAQAQDSCNLNPSSKNITLPPGCVLSGTNASSVDLGECKPVACLKNDSNFTPACKEPSFCCGPRSFEDVLVQCGVVVSFNLSKVTKCGCGQCSKQSRPIHGIARGPDDSPVKFVYLYFAGNVIARTNKNGQFTFSIPKDNRRAIVTFNDKRFKQFETEEKVFVIHEGQAMFYKIRLKRKAIPLAFNASEDLVLPLGNDSSLGSYADIEFPGDSLLTEDGEVYRGVAKAALSVTDPRNLTDVLSAVGDFTTVDEDGEEELLQTYGMIKLNLEDENGKALALSKPLTVTLDPEKLNLTVSDGHNVPVNLYWLDSKTGRWRLVGNLQKQDSKKRRRRQDRVFLVGKVTPAIARHSLNFDIPTQRIGVRVTTESSTDDVTVTVIRQDYGGYIQSPTVNGVACIPIWINTECFLQADKRGEYYDPDTDVIPLLPESTKGDIEPITTSSGLTYRSFEFKSERNDNKGPIYYDDARNGGSVLAQCHAPFKTGSQDGRQFVFKRHAQTHDEDDYELLNFLDGFTEGEWISPNLKNCYLKLSLVGSTQMLFVATSYIYKYGELTKVGFHITKSISTTEGADGKINCLQFRCPRSSESTYVLLSPLTSEGANCGNTSIHGSLIGVQNDVKCSQLPTVSSGPDRWLCIPKNDAGNGIYGTFKGDDLEGDTGKKRCLKGSQDVQSSDDQVVSVDNPSLEYTCS